MPAAANPDSGLPWWLTGLPRQTDSSPATLLWKPANLRGRQPPASSRESIPAVPPPYAGPAPAQAWAAPLQSGESVPSLSSPPSAEAFPKELGGLGPKETPANGTSRLSGLRSLLFTLGLKESDIETETDEFVDHLSPQSGRVAEHPVLARSPRPAPAPVASSGSSPRFGTAPPEVLPPAPIGETAGKGNAPAEESTFYGGRDSGYDEVQILPSRRGQYKGK